MDYLGYRAVGSVVRYSFTTHDATGAPVAPSSGFEAADLRIYKDGSATQRSSANGVTMTSPFDSVTGLHHVDIDLADNTDAGFFAAGSFYEVHLVPDETVDGIAVTKVLFAYDIGLQAVNASQVSASATAADNLETAFASTIAELSAVPAANAPLWTAIKWLFHLSRNKVTQTGSLQSLRNDADSGNIATAAVSDSAGTYTRGEFS